MFNFLVKSFPSCHAAGWPSTAFANSAEVPRLVEKATSRDSGISASALLCEATSLLSSRCPIKLDTMGEHGLRWATLLVARYLGNNCSNLRVNLDFSNAADIYSVNEAVSGCFQHAKAATRAYGGIFHLSRAMRVRRLCLSRHAGGRRHVSWLGRRCPGCLTWAAPTQS